MNTTTIGRIFKWLGACVLFLIVAVILLVFFAPTQVLGHIVGSQASTRLGRDFAIDGPIDIDWDWHAPRVRLHQLRLANLPGRPDANMVTIDEIDFHIRIWKLFEGQLNLPDISVTKPIIILEKLDEKTKNWNLPALSKASAATHTVVPTKRSNFPIIGDIAIQDGRLIYRDQTKNLDLTLDISTARGGGGAAGLFKMAGKGMLQDRPFEMNTQGGSLQMLRETKQQYPLHFHIKMGDTTADINGTFLDPVQMEGVDATLDIHGSSMADLFYLTLIPLPPTPTYQISGHLLKHGDVWTFENLKGKVGGSDLEGHLVDDLTQERGFLKAELTSNLLDLKDLAGFTGATPASRADEKAAPQQMKQAAREKASPKLLPDVPLDLTRLRASDLDVTLKAQKIIAPGLPMNDMNVRFNLKDGVLRIDPLEFGIANGKISGSLVLDGTKEIPHVESDLSLTRLSLKQFFADSRFATLTSGFIGGHFQLAGNGKSLAEVLGGSDGRVTFIMTGGTVSQLIVDAAGLDIGNAAPVLLGKDKATGIRCAVGDFGVENGILNSKVFVFDTTISNIAGDAHINLKNETIDARIETNPKSPTVTAHAPIIVKGPMKHPDVTLDLKEAAGRGAGAAVLSVFLTPLAAIIPFIEAGVGKDSDCGELISQARSAQAPAAKQ